MSTKAPTPLNHTHLRVRKSDRLRPLLATVQAATCNTFIYQVSQNQVTEFFLNGRKVQVDAPADTPLLWIIREHLGLTGTKFGCGIGQCGACTVHVDGEAVRSCLTALSDVGNKHVTTIEGLSPDGSHRLQRAWIAEQVPQCGYCQSGQIMQAAALLSQTPKPDRATIVAHMDGNICRCGTYRRIIKAIQRAAAEA
jgi:isoquinoline 1-oxidoreductase alpha subunit